MSRYKRSPSPMLRASRERSGFTMIEIIAVLAIIALITALSMGRISSIITRQRLNRAAVALSNDLQASFALAQRDRTPVRISFNSSTMELSLADAISGTVLRKTSLGNFDLTASNISASRTSLTVYPAGLANDTLSITLSATLGDTTYSQRVRMTRGGMVQIK